MSKIEIYTKNACIFCDRAKEVFKSKNLTFSEYNIFTNPEYLDELLKRSNGLKKMPQIFINNQHIGGFDKLQLLIDKGLLDKMIAL
mgnify:FL=1